MDAAKIAVYYKTVVCIILHVQAIVHSTSNISHGMFSVCLFLIFLDFSCFCKSPAWNV